MKEVLDYDFNKDYIYSHTIKSALRMKFLPEDAEYSERSKFEEELQKESEWAYKILQKYGKKKVRRYI